MTITKPRDLLPRQVLVESTVVDHHEVVSGSVHFGKVQRHFL